MANNCSFSVLFYVPFQIVKFDELAAYIADHGLCYILFHLETTVLHCYCVTQGIVHCSLLDIIGRLSRFHSAAD